MRQGSEMKLVAAFVVGAVVSFLIGLYVLGPLFSSYRSPKPPEARQPDQPSSRLLATADQSSILRRDVDTVPEHTTVVIEPLTRPAISPSPSLTHPPDELSPYLPSPPKPLPEPPQPEPTLTNPTPESPMPQTLSPSPAPSEVLPPTSGERRYRVRTGVFNNPQNADRLMEALAEQGYHPFKVEERTPSGETRYRVYAGATDDRDSAERLKKELADKGFAAIIEEVSGGQ